MADSNLKLIYFDLNGRGEIIRLLLSAAGKKFEDVRVTREEWATTLKPKSLFGQLPIFEIDGKAYAQSLAIANYVAREFGFYGNTNLDGLQIDQVAQLTEDLIQCYVKVIREPDEAKKAEIVNTIKREDVPRFLAYYEKLLKENDTGYLVGKGLTLADFIVYDVATGFLKSYVADQLDNYPLVSALVKTIGSNDRIKAYTAAQK